jgi:hypothetical protein
MPSLKRTSLLALILFGSHLIGLAQTARIEQPKIEQPRIEQPKIEQPKIEQPKIEQHGWKLVYVTYKDGKSLTQGDDKQFGEPSIALFVKDYPYQEGKEYPKLLVMYLSEDIGCDDKRPRVRKTLDEFDCGRRQQRTIRWFWDDNREENRRKLSELTKWDDVPPDTPVEAIYKYACRSWWASPKK